MYIYRSPNFEISENQGAARRWRQTQSIEAQVASSGYRAIRSRCQAATAMLARAQLPLVVLLLLLLVLQGGTAAAAAGGPPCGPSSPGRSRPWCDGTKPLATRVEALVEAIPPSTYPDQLTNGNFGGAPSNVTGLGIPTFDYANEACHGLLKCGICATPCSAGAVCCDDTCDAAPTSFPQVVGMAASFNRTLWRTVGATISTEARAISNTGVFSDYKPINFWAPNMNLLRVSAVPLTSASSRGSEIVYERASQRACERARMAPLPDRCRCCACALASIVDCLSVTGSALGPRPGNARFAPSLSCQIIVLSYETSTNSRF